MDEGSYGVRVGDKPIGFCLPEGKTGEETCLKDYLGRKVLVIFLKGSW